MGEINKKSVVAIGGGTGTHTVLSGLKKYSKNIDLTAIVAMTDSGGSTGRLRDEFGYLPVGDVRMALVALAKEDDEHEELLRKLFLHRFDKGGEISGHNFGNLFLVALTDILGSEEAAIEAASKVLRISGSVVPVTNEKVHLVAEYEDGSVLTGEHEIDEPPAEKLPSKIRRLSITPKATINPRAVEVIRNADLIIMGPGDLYTSILANCVVTGMQEALEQSSAQIMYISNLMTKWGQTTDMGVKEHMHELENYIGRKTDFVIINNAILREDLVKRYAEGGEYPVLDNTEDLTSKVISGDFVADEEVVTRTGDVLKRSLIRHDSLKLADAIMKEI